MGFSLRASGSANLTGWITSMVWHDCDISFSGIHEGISKNNGLVCRRVQAKWDIADDSRTSGCLAQLRLCRKTYSVMNLCTCLRLVAHRVH